jgi:hypothetical protein
LDFKHLGFSHQNEGKPQDRRSKHKAGLAIIDNDVGACAVPRTAAHPNVLQVNFGQTVARAGANFLVKKVLKD